MKRHLNQQLENWKNRRNRKALVLKGARQVGKTYVVREFGKNFEHYCEINFEERPDLKTVFSKNLDVDRILRDLSIVTGVEIVPGKTLLFLDEVNECPEALKSLRYFYEKLPELHVIASGSLIDFTIEKVGVPVGRVEYLHLYPMSFLEFLEAQSNTRKLTESLGHENLLEEVNGVVHQKLIEHLSIYFVVGGMPEAVKMWCETQDIKACMAIHQNLVQSYKDDFEKYAKKNQVKYLDLIFDKLPAVLGEKFTYAKISEHYKARELSPALDLLAKAAVMHRIYHSSGNGIPLGAEMNSKKFKVIFLDIALTQALHGLDYAKWIVDFEGQYTNLGYLTEAFVGQELIAYFDPKQKAQLYYWMREKPGAMAEVDYIIEGSGGHVIPIEVKSGHRGSAKSLRVFMKEKPQTKIGVRLSLRPYERSRAELFIPLYAVFLAARAYSS
ncbi:MAG: ATP-binding protein [Pseudobdellovibrionaceae bacterium]|nr:ATP-binding protein [Bdellovibrionales bacterium]USN48751.1 MAG: ATP-binding protein [Pseudobdellovibrionaceae bacterium]